MPRGGHRPGAGRKPSVATQMLKRFYDVDAIAAAGLTPLEVMVEAMRFFRSQAAKEQQQAKPDKQLVRDSLQLASNIAKDAAPYVHARVSVNDVDPFSKLGKKAEQAKVAAQAGAGTEWGDDLKPTVVQRAN